MLTTPLFLSLLLLLITANGSPVLAAKFLKEHLNAPVDGGYRLPDRQPVFGPAKTIRGLWRVDIHLRGMKLAAR